MNACNQLGSNGDNHMLQQMTMRGFMCSASDEKAMKSKGNSGIVRLCGGGRLCSPSCTAKQRAAASQGLAEGPLNPVVFGNNKTITMNGIANPQPEGPEQRLS